MKRVAFLLAATALALVLGSGMALAAVKFGTDRVDFLAGTKEDDVLHGKGGEDSIDGRGGDDILYGGVGNDEIISFPGDDILFGGRGNNTLFGGGGNDLFQATDINPDRPSSADTTPKKRDLVFCGSGRDTVVVDPGGIDFTASDCERMYVRTGHGDRLVRSQAFSGEMLQHKPSRPLMGQESGGKERQGEFFEPDPVRRAGGYGGRRCLGHPELYDVAMYP